jgi:hypothetical protein
MRRTNIKHGLSLENVPDFVGEELDLIRTDSRAESGNLIPNEINIPLDNESCFTSLDAFTYYTE